MFRIINMHQLPCILVEPRFCLRADVPDSNRKQQPCVRLMLVHPFCACLNVWCPIKLLFVYTHLEGYRVHSSAPLWQHDSQPQRQIDCVCINFQTLWVIIKRFSNMPRKYYAKTSICSDAPLGGACGLSEVGFDV